MKFWLLYLIIAFFVLQTPAWALRSSSYKSTLSENEDLKKKSSVQYNEDLKEFESSLPSNDELKEQESSFETNEGLKKQESSSQYNEELKEDSTVKTGDYDTPIITDDD